MAKTFKWSKQPGLKAEDITWLEVAGDPQLKTGLFRSGRPRNAVVICALQSAIYASASDYLRRNERVQDALFFLSPEEEVMVGTSLVSDRLFGVKDIDGEKRATSAVTLGHDSIQLFTMGLFVKGENRAVIPEGVSLAVPLMPIDEITSHYRNTTVASSPF